MRNSFSILVIFFLNIFCACNKPNTEISSNPVPDPVSKHTVSTLAGNGTAGFVDGSGTLARFKNPEYLVNDAMGNIYVADGGNRRIRKINSSGIVSTLAGSGMNGDKDGIGALADFRIFAGMAIDGAGNIYIADYNRVRRLSADGNVTTIAGSRTQELLNGNDTNAHFSWINGIALDTSGNVYVGDNGNGYSTIRKITSSGVVSTLAGGAKGKADGAGTTARFEYIMDLASDKEGNLYIADLGNGIIRKLNTSSEIVSTVVTPTIHPLNLALDAQNNIFLTQRYFSSGASSFNKIFQVKADSLINIAGSTIGYADGEGLQAKFGDVRGVTINKDGVIYVADRTNHCIRRVKAR